MLNALTVDVEEYFHPTEVQSGVDIRQWDTLPSRVGDEVSRILDLFESHKTKATFFILGGFPQRHPPTIRATVREEHKMAVIAIFIAWSIPFPQMSSGGIRGKRL